MRNAYSTEAHSISMTCEYKRLINRFYIFVFNKCNVFKVIISKIAKELSNQMQAGILTEQVKALQQNACDQETIKLKSMQRDTSFSA
jgi:hypothetical protein